MDLEAQPAPFFEWFFGPTSYQGALLYWGVSVAALAVGGLILAYLVMAARYGPNKAGDIIFKVLRTGIRDLTGISPRAVLALAWLAFQESMRRRVLVGFAVFVVLLLFAGWFMNAGNTDPAKLYLSFLLTATSYLVLLLSLLLSAFSLPLDIQNRTIYTIVTKPVRPSEVVLGRVLGFSAIGTGMLLMMGFVSYVFVIRTLDHTHELSAASLIAAADSAPGEPATLQGHTTTSRGHMHHVTIQANGTGVTDTVQNHWHTITPVDRDGGRSYVVGPPIGQLNARVPVYGKLQFRDRDGNLAKKGINVGNEWSYRSYVEGLTPAAAVWRFSGVRHEDFPDGLRLEMTIRVFRTYKGTIVKGIPGSLKLRNPGKPESTSTFSTFVAKEYSIDQHLIPLNFKDANGREVNLFKDLVSDDGELEVELSCLERAQFFGMAQPDVYLLPREGIFWVNFAKGYVGLWLQMVLLTTFGVMWSTFLNGAVAMLATLATMVGGFFLTFMRELATGSSLGGGTFESLVRIVGQQNLTSKLDENVGTGLALFLDQVGRAPLFIISHLLPDFPQISDVHYVANGFDIPANLLGIHLVMALGYVLPALLLGFLFFKIREVAK